MFFKQQYPDITAQDLHKVIQNLNAQSELVERQLREGSISPKSAHEEKQRLSSLISAYQENLMSALQPQQKNTP
ncbi:hypothetical protein OQJ13_06125 [Legionella sp. PATHC035]|uniref:hypothetical protein n=1 Tax=Legionella sp. PATHC035 TaxID=2992040 RepID=UPI002244637B|nr:hypothetical protein [Legionella sp. PATHC035]MCW8408548.1 hypothetical protein [Legionella sp. PATHC035]